MCVLTSLSTEHLLFHSRLYFRRHRGVTCDLRLLSGQSFISQGGSDHGHSRDRQRLFNQAATAEGPGSFLEDPSQACLRHPAGKAPRKVPSLGVSREPSTRMRTAARHPASRSPPRFQQQRPLSPHTESPDALGPASCQLMGQGRCWVGLGAFLRMRARHPETHGVPRASILTAPPPRSPQKITLLPMHTQGRRDSCVLGLTGGILEQRGPGAQHTTPNL